MARLPLEAYSVGDGKSTKRVVYGRCGLQGKMSFFRCRSFDEEGYTGQKNTPHLNIVPSSNTLGPAVSVTTPTGYEDGFFLGNR